MRLASRFTCAKANPRKTRSAELGPSRALALLASTNAPATWPTRQPSKQDAAKSSVKKSSATSITRLAFKDLLTALQAATDARNWTAVAQLSRLRLDVLGMLKSSHAGMADRGLSDETLLDKLAGSNPELRKQLQQLLGSDDFEKPEPSSTNNPGSSTKH